MNHADNNCSNRVKRSKHIISKTTNLIPHPNNPKTPFSLAIRLQQSITSCNLQATFMAKQQSKVKCIIKVKVKEDYPQFAKNSTLICLQVNFLSLGTLLLLLCIALLYRLCYCILLS